MVVNCQLTFSYHSISFQSFFSKISIPIPIPQINGNRERDRVPSLVFQKKKIDSNSKPVHKSDPIPIQSFTNQKWNLGKCSTLVFTMVSGSVQMGFRVQGFTQGTQKGACAKTCNRALYCFWKFQSANPLNKLFNWDLCEADLACQRIVLHSIIL